MEGKQTGERHMGSDHEHGSAGPLKAALTALTTVSTIIGIIVFATGKTNVPALLGLNGEGTQKEVPARGAKPGQRGAH